MLNQKYLDQISKFEQLDATAEQELAKKSSGGDIEVRNHLVRANLRLVVSLALNYREMGVPLKDLVSEGNLGQEPDDLATIGDDFEVSRETIRRKQEAAMVKIRREILRLELVNNLKRRRLRARKRLRQVGQTPKKALGKSARAKNFKK